MITPDHDSSVCIYNPLTITPCSGYVVVFAEKCDDGSGQYVLRGSPLDAIGIAETTLRYFRHDAGRIPELVGERRLKNDVVGFQLMESGFVVVQSFSNFAGICKVGDDVNLATGALDLDILDRLKPTATPIVPTTDQ